MAVDVEHLNILPAGRELQPSLGPPVVHGLRPDSPVQSARLDDEASPMKAAAASAHLVDPPGSAHPTPTFQIVRNTVSPSRLLSAAAIVLTGLALGAPAFAHIDPDPTDAQAGSDISVGFTVRHGCDGSPTVQLDMQLPDGVGGAAAEPPDGWTGGVVGNVVSFQGGPLADDQELTFRVRMILPATPDATIYFPFVQRCEVGEIRWIDIPSEGSDAELDEPAPAMQLFGPVATTPAPSVTTTATTSATTPATTTAAPTTEAPATTTPTTATPTTTTSPSSTVISTTDELPTSADETDTRSSRPTGAIVATIAAAAAAAGAAALIVRLRRRSR